MGLNSDDQGLAQVSIQQALRAVGADIADDLIAQARPDATLSPSDDVPAITFQNDNLALKGKGDHRMAVAALVGGSWRSDRQYQPGREGRGGGCAPNSSSGGMDHNGQSWRMGMTPSIS